MQHYKHARKKTLQPHYEPFDIMGVISATA